jgi:hypothetical protein
VVSPFDIEDEHGECADAKLSCRDVKVYLEAMAEALIVEGNETRKTEV